jgi:hypothetical protein
MTTRNSRAGPLSPDERSVTFYRQVLHRLIELEVPFLVGGGYAFRHHTGIDRVTRDFDVFMKPESVEEVLEQLRRDGFDAAMVFPHWLAKVQTSDDYVDVIFGSGNGVARVDDVWFEQAIEGDVLDTRVRICPIEEMIWSKAFIMERERFDGADIVHLIHSKRGQLDWKRLLARFGPHRRVLLAHLILFGFVYPSDRDMIPEPVMRELTDALRHEREQRNGAVCLGTLLSRSQYLPDLDRGYKDGRLAGGTMSRDQIAIWTDAADVPPPRG